MTQSAPTIFFVQRYHPHYLAGGAEVQCWRLARELARRGWDAHYVSEDDRYKESREVEGVTLHSLPENPPPGSWHRERMRELHETFSPDVIYCRDFTYHTLTAFHDAPSGAFKIWAMSNDFLGTFSSMARYRWRSDPIPRFLKNYSKLYRRYQLAAAGRKLADLVLTQHSGQQTTMKRLGYQAEVARGVHPPVELPEDHRRKGPPQVIWVGSVKSSKRPQLFLKLAEACRDLDAQFAMAGTIYEPQLEKEVAAAESKASNFRYLGLVSQDKIDALYKESSLLVQTSRGEGFPNTFYEAWFRGLPVVSLDVDPDGLLEHEKAGRCVHSPAELIKAVREILGNAELRGELSRNARALAQREFSLEGNVTRLEELIASYAGVQRSEIK